MVVIQIYIMDIMYNAQRFKNKIYCGKSFHISLFKKKKKTKKEKINWMVYRSFFFTSIQFFVGEFCAESTKAGHLSMSGGRIFSNIVSAVGIKFLIHMNVILPMIVFLPSICHMKQPAFVECSNEILLNLIVDFSLKKFCIEAQTYF